MSTPDANNPLWLAYQELWKILRDSTEFAALFKEKNQIDYFDETRKFPSSKDTLSNADFPAVKVVPGVFVPKLDASSNSAFGTIQWQIQVSTGEQSAERELLTAWTIFRAMSKWTTRLWALRWNSKQYISVCRVRDSKETLDDRRENRGIRGWSAVWTGETELYFATADIQA